MNIRTATTAAALVFGLALTGCGSDTTAKKEPAATEATEATEAAADTGPVDCEDQNLSQAEWTEHCADDAGAEEAPDTDLNLKVGQGIEYEDKVEVTVDSVKTITEFGEYDERPESGQTAFRVHLTVANKSDKPLNLEDLYVMTEGATNGGEAMPLYVEKGAKDITGRVAPGVTVEKNTSFVLDKEYGKQVVVTVERMSAETDFYAEPATFTGPIR